MNMYRVLFLAAMVGNGALAAWGISEGRYVVSVFNMFTAMFLLATYSNIEWSMFVRE